MNDILIKQNNFAGTELEFICWIVERSVSDEPTVLCGHDLTTLVVQLWCLVAHDLISANHRYADFIQWE